MIISLPIYECKVHYIKFEKNIDIDNKQRTIYKKHKINQVVLKEEDGCSSGKLIDCFTDYYILVSTEQKGLLNTILHELTHCIDHILKNRGIFDEEARAYLTAYLGDKILQHEFSIYK